MPAIERYSPPTSYNIAALLRQEPGAWQRVLYGTVQRSFFIVPGLYLAGLRGRQLAKASLFASASITASLIWYYWYFSRYTDRASEALSGYSARRRLHRGVRPGTVFW